MFISGQFLQSKKWEDFQHSIGRKTFRINDILIIKLPLKAGFSYLYCPKGPKDINNDFLQQIKKLAKKEKSVFIRCEPITLSKNKFIKTKDIQPACTSFLNLENTEETLLKEMKQKTRYNIKLAEKKGVKIKKQTSTLDLQIFYNLLQETYKRQGIKTHPKVYYKKLATFNDIFIAYYNNKAVAGAMVNFDNQTATYLHGGSIQEHKEVMAPYLLHWDIIKEAKKMGYKYYDWWGVDEKKWPGITKFKNGFGGEIVCTPGTVDISINKILYILYKYARK